MKPHAPTPAEIQRGYGFNPLAQTLTEQAQREDPECHSPLSVISDVTLMEALVELGQHKGKRKSLRLLTGMDEGYGLHQAYFLCFHRTDVIKVYRTDPECFVRACEDYGALL